MAESSGAWPDGRVAVWPGDRMTVWPDDRVAGCPGWHGVGLMAGGRVASPLLHENSSLDRLFSLHRVAL